MSAHPPLRPPRWPGAALMLALLAAAACTPQPTKSPGGVPQAQDAAAQQAWTLRRAGELEAAAREFLKIAEHSSPPQSMVYRLHAAETYLDAKKTEAARNIIAQAAAEKSSNDLRAWTSIISARLDLADRRYEDALAGLEAAQRFDQTGARAREIHAVRADVLTGLRRPLQAAAERILLEPLLGESEEIDGNRKAIWRIVSGIPAADLSQQLSAAPETLRGWMELAVITQRSVPKSADYAARLERWKQTYPNHPAGTVAGEEQVSPAAQTALPMTATPRRVALLLPLEGPFAGAGAAIRDGFIMAWYADLANGARPQVDIYNATAESISAAYDRAVADGAELVVGPLEKNAVETLAKRGSLTVPTLALNQAQTDTVTAPAAERPAAALIQFGLSPEDEARQIAERAWFDGRGRALVITPDDPWGERVFQAFREHWERLGGQILDREVYAGDTRNFAPPVKKLLDIEGSERRTAELKRIVGRPLVSEPHPRQDADFVFMAAFPNQARQLRPQLQFFRAEALPVYATSHVYVGNADANRDLDLENVIFGDMPWRLSQDATGLKDLISRKWPDEAVTYAPLYALGVDAYRIIPHLTELQSQPAARFEGATGALMMNGGGRIQRQLTWARFTNGMPVLLDAPATTP